MDAQTFFALDLEATGLDLGVAQVVEVACVRVTMPGDDRAYFHELVRPTVPIPAETSAIHHIVDADVAGCRDWDRVSWELMEFLGSPDDRPLIVAHNVDLERHFVGPLFPAARWLCTYRAAVRVWPGAPGHSNEVLRYWLGLPGLGRLHAQHPHSAMHDALVTAGIALELLNRDADGASLDQLLSWADEPALLPRCTIGRYRGMAWGDVPVDFLEWIVYRATDMRADVLHSASLELARRQVDEQEIEW